jgi:membrane-associated phospholipid phosphatase
MKINKIFPVFIFLICNIFHISSASGPDNDNSLIQVTPLTDIGTNFINSYTGWNSLYHIAAVGITYVSVQSGIDAEVLRITSGMDPAFSSVVGHTGIMLGYFAPIVVPATMYFMSEKNNDLRIASYAVVQSVAMAFVVGSFLKAVTGRKGPDPNYRDKNALSRDFNFGFMQGGLHYGWPSGHLMVNTAMATVLATYYKEQTWIKNIAYGYIAFLTFSMLIHDRGSAHWFSDIVAGGLMGFAFGMTVGKSFRNYRRSQNHSTQVKNNSGNSLHLIPHLSLEYTGVSLNFSF